MIADLDMLLARPSRAAWRELRHHFTALGPDALRIDEWSDALSRWPDAWRVAAPGWLPIASHPSTWPGPAVAATPLFALARALDFMQGRALLPNERVLAGMCALDPSHITHVRHREFKRFIAPSDRILVRLLRAGAYDSVTHLMVEWPTEEELAAIAALPKLCELQIANHPSYGPGNLEASAFGRVLAAAPALRALSASAEVWSSVRESPLVARLTRGISSYESEVEGWRPSEPVLRRMESVDELTARSELVTTHASSVQPIARTHLSFCDPPAAFDREATYVTFSARKKLVPKVSKAWMAQDLASLRIEVAHVMHQKGQAFPAPIRPRHLIIHLPVPAASILADGAALRGLEIGARVLVERLWSVSEIRELLDVLTSPLEILALNGTELTSSDLAAVLRHPMLRSLRVFGIDEGSSVRSGRKYEKRARVPLDMDVIEALTALEELRWLRLEHFAASTPEVFDGLRLPKLFGIELDVTGATKLDHALDLIGPEMESMELSGLHTIVRVRDELLHLGSYPHLEKVLLIGLARLEDDEESLEYSVGGVLAPLLAQSGLWLDEPV